MLTTAGLAREGLAAPSSKTVSPSDVSAAPAACPICGGCGREVLELPAYKRQVLGCAGCGFTFIWPRIEQDFSRLPETAYYADWQHLDFAGVSFVVNDVTAAVGRPVMQRLNTVDPPAVLDAGCGAGHVLLDFRAHGWRVQGVDPWAAVSAIGRKYYRLQVETARLETATIEPGSQDVVLALDVLQYVAHPKAFLKSCAAALKRGGLFYLTVPNFASAESRRETWNSQLFLPLSYLSYFTESDLRRLLEESGFYRIDFRTHGGPENDQFLHVHARNAGARRLSWSDLSEEADDRDLPPLDRAQVDETTLSPEQRAWRENGYLILPGLIPEALIERYCAIREHIGRADGWSTPTPYLDVPEIRDLCLYKPLSDVLADLIGEPMALHLNLTGWVSTERDWHQDNYLNPPTVNGHYLAVWTALDRIQPDAGPFEFVPGSHRWPIIRQSRVLDLIGYDGEDPTWPWASERLLTAFFESEIRKRGAQVQSFLGNKGDVLIWHARLLHRGSLPRRPGAERRSMIAHYSAVGRRTDMPWVCQHPSGGQYFVFEPPADKPVDEGGNLIDKARRWAGLLKNRLGISPTPDP
jgi:SAM-dependent methyltransferase